MKFDTEDPSFVFKFIQMQCVSNVSDKFSMNQIGPVLSRMGLYVPN